MEVRGPATPSRHASETGATRLSELTTAERQDECTEFLADRGKFDIEIDSAERLGDYTMRVFAAPHQM
jgi:hypothetical protein